MGTAAVPPGGLEIVTGEHFIAYLIENELVVAIAHPASASAVVVEAIVGPYAMLGPSVLVAWRDALAAFATAGTVRDFATIVPMLLSSPVSQAEAAGSLFVFDGVAIRRGAGGSPGRIAVSYRPAPVAPAVTLGFARSIGFPATGTFALAPFSWAYLQPHTTLSVPEPPPVALVFTASATVAPGTVLPVAMIGRDDAPGGEADGLRPPVATGAGLLVELGATPTVVHFDLAHHVFVPGPPPR